MTDTKEILFNVSATLTSRAVYDMDGKTVRYDKSVIENILSKLEAELQKGSRYERTAQDNK